MTTTNAIGNACGNDFLITRATDGTNTVKTIRSDSNSAGSYAEQNIKVAGTSSGDAWCAWAVGTTNQYALGIDNSDSDRLKLTYAASGVTPSTAAQIMTITTAGEVTKPLQPCFCATKSAMTANVTGDGTEYVIIPDVERFDQNGDYNSATGIFSSPVTGKYLLGAWVNFTNGATPTRGGITLVTSNNTYYGHYNNPSKWDNTSGVGTYGVQVLADMDAADTAYFQIKFSASTKTTSVGGNNGYAETFFYGVLKE